MILTILPREILPLEELAKKWLGKTVFISWPHLVEALVIGVSNSKTKISIAYPQPKQITDGNINFNTDAVSDVLLATWNIQKKSIIET